jgi:hypothetical protein
VAPPQTYRTIAGDTVEEADCGLLARTKALAVMHKAYAVTGGICVSAAAMIEGTVVYGVASQRARLSGEVRLGHPSGVSSYLVSVARGTSGEFELRRVAVAGTARRIMDGYVSIPRRRLSET